MAISFFVDVRNPRIPDLRVSFGIGDSGLERAADPEFCVGPFLVGERQAPSAIPLSDVDSLSNAQRIFQFDAQVSDGAIDLGVAEQQLDRAQVAGLPVDF